MDTKYKLDNKS